MNLEDLYRLLRVAHVQAQNIVDTAIHEPLLLLDEKLCVAVARRSFFEVFCVDRNATSAGTSTSSAMASGTSPTCAICSRRDPKKTVLDG